MNIISKILPSNNYQKPNFECIINNLLHTITTTTSAYNLKSDDYIQLECAIKCTYNYQQNILIINIVILNEQSSKHNEMFIFNNITDLTYHQVIKQIVQEYLNKEHNYNNIYSMLLMNVFALCVIDKNKFISFLEYNIRHIIEDIVKNNKAMWILEDDVKNKLQLQNNLCSYDDIMNSNVKCNLTLQCIRKNSNLSEKTVVKNAIFY